MMRSDRARPSGHCGLNTALDHTILRYSLLFRQTVPAFPVLIGVGILAGLIAGMLGASAEGLARVQSVAIVAAALTAGMALPAVRIVIGTQDAAIRWASNGVYHYQVAAFAGAGLFAAAMRWSVPASLGVVAVGMAVTQIPGRTGCLLAGCCYGRPHVWGVRYHAKPGMPAHLIGVRLFPIQAFEVFWMVLVVVPGCLHFLSVRQPGNPFAWYVATYGAARFVLEFGRGDEARHYFRGLSEPQWTAVLLTVVTAAASLVGVLDISASLGLGVVLIAGILFATSTGLIWWHPVDRDLLIHWHVKEVADAVQWARQAPACFVGRTTLGYRIAMEHTDGSPAGCRGYVLSNCKTPLSLPKAKALGRLIVALNHADAPYHVVEIGDGRYGLLLQPAEAAYSVAGDAQFG